jgi:polyhydroxybutyrate depolymerase
MRVVLVIMLLSGAELACSGPRDDAAPAIAGTRPATTVATTSATKPNPAVSPIGETLLRTVEGPDGRERTYRLYVPTSLPTDRPVPLLIALHGGTGTGVQFARNSELDGIAEANGFIVAFPDGIEIVGTVPGRVWNGGYCCGPAVTQNVDDVGFISRLIDDVKDGHRIDDRQVFAAGHSNGGIMAYRLACELSDKIVGVGLQAGSLGIDRCEPEHPVSLIHIHGTADDNHPIDGGKGSKGISGVSFRPAIDGVRALAAADGCASESRHRVDGPVATDTWSACKEGTEVELVTVDGASHAWMGHEPLIPAVRALVGEPSKDLDASAAIWEFLVAHPRR